MAIICNNSPLLPTDEPDSWFWTNGHYGTTARTKHRAGTAKMLGWTKPHQGTDFTPYNPWSQMLLRFTARLWDHDPNLIQANYNSAALTTTYTNAQGLSRSGNGFELFMYQATASIKQAFLQSEYLYHSPLLGAPTKYLTATPPVYPGPTIQSAAWSLSGTIDATVLPSFTDSAMLYLFSVVPPTRPQGIKHSAIDLWAMTYPGNPNPTLSVPHAWWTSALKRFALNQNWQVMITQVPASFSAAVPTAPSFAAVTIAP